MLHRKFHGLAVTVAILAVCATCWPRPALAQFNTPATTVQLPTFGVAVDVEGLLSATAVADPGRRLWGQRRAAALKELPVDIHAAAPLRYVSLRAVLERISRAGGRPLDNETEHLGGLTRLQYVFCAPGEGDGPGDIVLAGPAEPWALDLSGRPIGLHSGRAVLQLRDLAAAVRLFPPGSKGKRPFVGCTIDPAAESLQAFQEFQRTIPRAVHTSQRAKVAALVASGTAEALGNANIRVFGVSPQTHFARSMVEADYSMKRIAIGLEPPPVAMATFASTLKGPPPSLMQRWWFVPALEGLRLSPDRHALELTRQGVQLSAEAWQLDDAGTLRATGQPVGRAAQAYADSFTKRYAEIAVSRPVFGELRNIVDMTIAAAVVCNEQWCEKARLDCSVILDERLYAIETEHAPQQVSCPVNVFWKGRRMLSLAGGGVQWQPARALQELEVVEWRGPAIEAPESKAWRWQ